MLFLQVCFIFATNKIKMIKSMTGYGKAERICHGKTITVEIKTLNSKQLDLSIKLPSELKIYEFDYRNIMAAALQRGKIDAVITVTNAESEQNVNIHKDVISSYLKQIKEISEEFNIRPTSDLAMLIFRMPGIFATPEQQYDEEFENNIKSALSESLKQVDTFRINEGDILKKDLINRIHLILEYLDQVIPFEAKRHENIRQKLTKNISDIIDDNQYDKNRFEQELIYYLEKLDITEEKVRLKKHCDYFIESIDEDSAGKKLGFISQEIGREINTLGSKANDAEIQRLVVMMKDELEKIKEQLFNIL